MMWEVAEEDGKLRLRPKDPELKIGGYGYSDVVVYKGAPVSVGSIKKYLVEAGMDVDVHVDGNELVVELREGDPQKVVDVVSQVMVNADKDLTTFEKVVRESIESYLRKTGQS